METNGLGFSGQGANNLRIKTIHGEAMSVHFFLCSIHFFEDDIAGKLPTQGNHRHAPARIYAAADKQQIVKFAALFGSLEGLIFPEITDYAVDRAAVGCVQGLDIIRSPEVFNNHVSAEVFHAHAFKLVQDSFFQCLIIFDGARMFFIDPRDVR